MIYLRFSLAIAIWMLAGAGIVAACRRPTGRAEFLGLSYILGIGAVGIVSVILMLCGVTIGPWVAVGLAVLGLAALLRFRPTFVPDGFGWGMPVALLAAAALLISAASSNHLHGDGGEFWSLKAKSLERHGTFRNPDFTTDIRPHRHSGYPLLLPSSYAWIHWATGTTDERPIRLALGLFFLASLPVIHAMLKDRLPPKLSSWLVAVYAWLPLFAEPATGLVEGFSDYPLAIFVLIGFSEARRHAGLAAFALLCAAQTKDEGGAIALMSLLLLPLFVGWRRAAIALPALVVFGAWCLAKRAFVPDLEVATSGTHIIWSRFPGVVWQTLRDMGKAPKFSLLWLWVALLVLVRFPRRREPESLLAWAAAGMMAVYICAWLVIPATHEDHPAAFNGVRLLMHTVPLLFVWTSWRLADSRMIASRPP